MLRTQKIAVLREIYPCNQASSLTELCVCINDCSSTVQISSQGESKLEMRVSGHCGRNKERIGSKGILGLFRLTLCMCVCLVIRSSGLGILQSISLRMKQAANVLQGRSE